jgi:hypothetical protein
MISRVFGSCSEINFQDFAFKPFIQDARSISFGHYATVASKPLLYRNFVRLIQKLVVERSGDVDAKEVQVHETPCSSGAVAHARAAAGISTARASLASQYGRTTSMVRPLGLWCRV